MGLGHEHCHCQIGENPNKFKLIVINLDKSECIQKNSKIFRLHNCILFNQIQLLAKHCGKNEAKDRTQKERQIYEFATNWNLSQFI